MLPRPSETVGEGIGADEAGRRGDVTVVPEGDGDDTAVDPLGYAGDAEFAAENLTEVRSVLSLPSATRGRSGVPGHDGTVIDHHGRVVGVEGMRGAGVGRAGWIVGRGTDDAALPEQGDRGAELVAGRLGRVVQCRQHRPGRRPNPFDIAGLGHATPGPHQCATLRLRHGIADAAARLRASDSAVSR